MKSIKYIAISSAFLIYAISASAQTADEALQFSRIVRDPAIGAMGGAGVASTNNTAYASFINSAVIPFSEKKFDAGLSYQSWAPDGTKSTNINFGMSTKLGEKFALTAGFVMQNAEEYDITDESGNPDGTYKPKDMQLNFGLAYKFSDKLGAGATFKYLSQDNAPGSKLSAPAFDVFLLYKVSDFNVAAGISTFGGSVKDEAGKSFDIPSSATVGGNWNKTFNTKHNIEASVDADYYFSGNFTAALGAQYTFNDLVSVRAGYHYGSDDCVLPAYATIGCGVRHKFGNTGFGFDVAYILGSETLQNTLTLGIKLFF